MIRVLVSSSNGERVAAARRFIESFPPGAERLLVGASRPAADDCVRRLSVSAMATFGLHRFSLTQLAARLATAEFARQGLTHGSSLAAEAVAARAVFEAVEGRALEYFKPVAQRPGFARAAAATLNELRLARIEPALLEKLPAAGPDLCALLRLAEQQLASASIADRSALFRAAASAVSDPLYATFAKMPVLLLDVPIRSSAERDFLRRVLGSAPEVLATVPEGDARTLDALAHFSAVQIERQPLVGSTALVRLKANLFSPSQPPQGKLDETVLLFSAPGESRECVEVARRILQEAGRGVRFDEMAVVLRSPNAHSAPLETALSRAKIPAYFADGTRRPDPAGRAFLALLACKAERLSAKRFAEYLSLGQVPELGETGVVRDDRTSWASPADEALGPPAADSQASEEEPVEPETPVPDEDRAVREGDLRAPRNWERLIVEAAVIGGSERWKRRLAGLEAELRLRLDALGSEEPERATVERDLKNLGHLRSFALPVIDTLAALPSLANWQEWLERLRSLAPLTLRRPQRVLKLLADLEPLAQVGLVSFDHVRAILAPHLSTLEVEPPRRPYGRVFVATPEAMRGRSFRVVFVPGIAERMFPQPPREDPLLLDNLRGQLRDKSGTRDSELDVPLRDDRARQEQLLLRLGVGAAAERV